MLRIIGGLFRAESATSSVPTTVNPFNDRTYNEFLQDAKTIADAGKVQGKLSFGPGFRPTYENPGMLQGKLRGVLRATHLYHADGLSVSEDCFKWARALKDHNFTILNANDLQVFKDVINSFQAHADLYSCKFQELTQKESAKKPIASTSDEVIVSGLHIKYTPEEKNLATIIHNFNIAKNLVDAYVKAKGDVSTNQKAFNTYIAQIVKNS